MTDKTDQHQQKKDPIDDNVDWTPQEFQEWVKAGLVPQELLESTKQLDLVNYLRANKATLYKHYRRNPEEDRYIATIPPQSEWHKAPDIVVRDKETGEIVSVLEMAAKFDLCEGVSLQVKAKELPDWEKETADARKLDKEQHETFKTALERLGPGNRLTRKDIVTLIEEIRKTKRKPTKYRQSGHLVDEKLKYTMPPAPQTLFDALTPEVKQKIEESKIEVKVEGIKLTPPQNKLVHALNFLLHEKSFNNRDTKGDGFYEGNLPSEIVPYGPESKSKAAVLKFRPSELYKAYIGHDEYSGHDIHFINNELLQLEGRRMLIKYDRIKKVTKNKKTEILTDRIEDFQSLIKIISFIPDLTDEEKELLDKGDRSIREKKGEIVIALNPIFTDQIDTKFIEFPADTNRRLVIAAGGHNKVTASMTTLMEWMLREISNKRYKAEINEDKLPYILGLEKYVKQNRKKLLSERIEKDIDAIKNMGIILRSETVPNSVGAHKWVFHLNKDYE